jgi:hypothetical protein
MAESRLRADCEACIGRDRVPEVAGWKLERSGLIVGEEACVVSVLAAHAAVCKQCVSLFSAHCQLRVAVSSVRVPLVI